MAYDCIVTETQGERALRTGVVRLHRPKQLNALNDRLMDELGEALLAFDRDDSIGCIVLAGGEKAFAAGADIASIARLEGIDAVKDDFITRNWETIRLVRKPVIAAVAGFALGGGCELVMMCDIVIAAESARFGQPELKLGVVPGAGGTQRLPRAIGKAKAMDLLLTARLMDAAEAERSGLVSRVVPDERLMEEAFGAAEAICALGMPSVMLAKDCVNRSFEGPLSEGLAYERRLFQLLFGSADQREGMDAFLAKRKPQFTHR